MACFTLLFVVILTISEISSLRCSDQQLPASGGDHLQQVTTVQYCHVDNCTIKRIDTGEKLEIAYTTDSFLVATPTDGHTSVMIAKTERESPCMTPTIGRIIGFLVMGMLIMVVSGYNATIHLIFKESRNAMGKLIMLYSLSVVLQCLVIYVVLVTHSVIALNSQITCQLITTIFRFTAMNVEGFATCILTHFAYIMYSNLCLSKVTTERSQYLFRRYIAYVVGTVSFFLGMMITYDMITGAGRYTLQPDGYCIFISDIDRYKTIWISKVNTAVNKIIQLTMFATYLFCFYKIKQNLELSSQHHQKLSKVAIAMGATVGLSQLIWLGTAVNPDYSLIANIAGSAAYFIQQCVIMSTLICTNKMSRLCQEIFPRNQVAPAPN